MSKNQNDIEAVDGAQRVVRKLLLPLTALLSLLFVAAGLAKLVGVTMVVDNFIRWGYPYWFVYPVGAVEIVCAIALWPRGLSFHAAGALAAVMLFAFGTHMSASQTGQAMVPLLVLVLCALVAYGRQMERYGTAQRKKKPKRKKRTKTKTKDAHKAKKRSPTREKPPVGERASPEQLMESLAQLKQRTEAGETPAPPAKPVTAIPPPPLDDDDEGGLPPPPL